MTKFKKKNKGIQFKIGKAIHMIPSKDFPLASKSVKDIRIFHSNTTKQVENVDIEETFNSFNYQVGRCFENAKGLKDMLEKKGIKGWDYYSGWLFPIKGYPVFHAWLVKNNSILDYTDYSFDKSLLEKIKHVDNEEKLRELLSDAIVERNKLPSSKIKVFGKAHFEHFYVGTKDNFESSANIYTSLSSDHLSYSENGVRFGGLSDLQLQIKKKSNK